MSTVKIALQPPPNVDFVVGYPGIPPGARDRPQAAVKGAVEVRVGPQGAKAKWVRVELKKIETLPGGGQANSYYDHIGSSPIVLWQSSEEYGILQSVSPFFCLRRMLHFPFLIRIPESIPPSIALDKGAGIRYELVATACTLGKKGFFRRRKTTVVSQATTINIDKHELHSTWPVYSQPESRSTLQDGVRLTVERSRTCYGPGDRVSITAILRAESSQPVVLRGFEFTLRETSVFRAGPQAGGGGSGIGGGNKRSGPQIRVANIGEQKVPLSATLYNGSQHKAEMGCLIPNTHTTTSLNAARHIDITYVIVVRAWVGAAQQSVAMELPVILSNWPRNVSEEAIRRIGNAPSLCVTSPSSTAPTVPITSATAQHHHSNSFSGTPDYGFSSGGPVRPGLIPPKQHVQYSSAPIGPNGSAHRDMQQLEVDELGELKGRRGPSATVDHAGYAGGVAQPTMARIDEDSSGSGAGSPLGGGDVRARPSFTGSVGGAAHHRRKHSASATTAANPQNRLTITNYSEYEAEAVAAENGTANRPGSAGGANRPKSAGQRGHWPTAEEEKKQLYEHAVARVQKVQGTAALAHTVSLNEPGGPASPSSSPASGPAPASGGASTSSKKPMTPKKSTTPIWPTAEEEKVRLYDQAQAIAKKTQAYGAYSPSLHSRASSEANAPPRVVTPPRTGGGGGGGVGHVGMVSPSVPISAGAALYQSAVSSMNVRPGSSGMHASSSSGAQASQSSSGVSPSQSQSSPSRNVPHYPSAADEKAALKLYSEAKRAVDRNQTMQMPPIAYEALYPSPGGGSSGAAGNAGGETRGAQENVDPDKDLPPPFEASGSERPLQDDNAHLNEKERLRRQYEAQDAAANAALEQGSSAQVSSPAYTSGGGLPSYAGPPAESGLSEKEILRRHFEGQDAAASAVLARQQSPPPFVPHVQTYQNQSPSPPPMRINGTRTQPVPPTINEEKAQLKAKYEAEERAAKGTRDMASGSTNGFSSTYDDLYASPPSRHPYANGGVLPSSPPPLMPQTREEDIRARHYYVGVEEALHGLPAMRAATARNPHLETRPFSPGTKSPQPRP
ncbi:hypothetical protein V8B97DRAFT_2020138 [Scleroderma yunnanense]